MTVWGEVLELFDRRGSNAYFGEHVSMREHMLQAAHFAAAANAPQALVLAALLHDVGHLVATVPDALDDWHTDARHEEVGSRWLAARFPAQVYEPVRLHVPAKRYLCATDPAYVSLLSEASVLTLRLQGGAMAPAELLQFETQQYFPEAIRVRRWDDQGKVAGLPTCTLEHYGPLVEAFALRD